MSISGSLGCGILGLVVPAALDHVGRERWALRECRTLRIWEYFLVFGLGFYGGVSLWSLVLAPAATSCGRASRQAPRTTVSGHADLHSCLHAPPTTTTTNCVFIASQERHAGMPVSRSVDISVFVFQVWLYGCVRVCVWGGGVCFFRHPR
ncbi:hypothetical protein JKF63_06679 [Porcisia hertigi]|uniref:Uncharacterized protein n=1 Tax=Porcisia hertigi TaxID=2761500 RepID=A0A836IC58_9TRYP|nr:hypothetical protein JKF63_06679 [Porcisia hertigi]